MRSTPATIAITVALGAALVICFVGSFGMVDADARPSATYVVQLGKAVGPWRIGMSYEKAPGLIRVERHPEHLGPGCVAGPQLATRIDHYRGIRLSWYDDADGNLFLADASTTRTGDRTSRGLVVRRTTLEQARRMYPQYRLETTLSGTRFALGSRSLMVFQRTGYESGRYLTLWFNTRGVLTALSTGQGGC